MDLVGGKIPDDLDRSWYIARARRIVQKTPGYRHRSPKRLDGHALALEVFNHGLVPVPKWDGKAQPKGSDAAIPTMLWDWSTRVKTVGSYTGPRGRCPGARRDEFERFRKWVEKDNDPLFGDRWRTLDGCLVSVHGATTAEAVRTGRGRGKLIFRLGPAQIIRSRSWRSDTGRKPAASRSSTAKGCRAFWANTLATNRIGSTVAWVRRRPGCSKGSRRRTRARGRRQASRERPR